MNVTTIGIDLAKSVFQLHGVDAQGAVVFRRKLRRGGVLDFLRDLPVCLIGLEACATAHFWAREIGALGHEVRLIPPAYVKPYVKRQKNDAADAEAICEAVTRPSMRFVPVKSEARQGVMMLHRTRDLLMRQRTMLLNAIRAHLAEFGIITAQGPHKLAVLLDTLDEDRLPAIARSALTSLTAQLDSLAAEIRTLERQLMAWHRTDETSQRLETIPGVGLITATAISASIPDPSVFKTGRQFAAFLGLVPRQNSSGGKERLGRISKMGDGYLRRLLVVGATSVIRRVGTNTSATGDWVRRLLERKPARVATVAMANKTARIAWAVLARGETYRAPARA
ncbi:IS110 family transposase [Maricaulis maris]|jgi:transposase|uniref:IS110 family transposase n=1 Tax=Maricaulis maris TaxID=74318 RepID=UPI0029200850|nr:IS110 family transposase [Maricaulis maris]